MSQDIQQRIDEAALTHSAGTVIDGRVLTSSPASAKSFTAGANFTLNTILPEEMVEFEEWINKNSISNMGEGWVDFGPYPSLFQGTLSTTQLIEIFKNRDKA